ncbi:MAG TPA: hypothetical protein VFC94_03155 [Bacteroidaceae bacterium]|nr:hypothetical protein [Bacteroidaceae bacterium]
MNNKRAIRMRKIIVGVILTIFIFLPLLGQQTSIIPSRSLIVEGAYNPNVAEALKIMPMPDKMSVTTPKEPVKYILEDKFYTNYSRDYMEAFVGMTNSAYKYRSVTRLGYGLNNNIDGLLDYNLELSEIDNLKIEAHIQGWNAELAENWRSKFFNSNLGLFYSHKFYPFKFELDSRFCYENFNYMKGKMADSLVVGTLDNIQNIIAGSVNAKIVSITGQRLKYSLSTGWYGLSRGNISGKNIKNRENLFRLNGFLSFAYGEGELGFSYSQKMSYYDWNTWMNSVEYKNNSFYHISPFITFQRDLFTSKAGLNLAVFRGKTDKIIVSPNLSLFYRESDRLSVFGQISGRVIDNEIRELNAISPYWGEYIQIEDGYSIADISIGMTYNLSSFASISFKGGVEYLWNEIFQTVSDSIYVNSLFTQKNANVLYGEFSSLVSAGGVFDLNMFIGAYKRYSENNEEFFSYKPCLDVNAKARGKIFSTLFAKASFNYILFTKSSLLRVPSITNLSFGLDYAYKENLGFFLNFDNLMNCRYSYYAGYIDQRITCLAGAIYRF